MLDPRAIQGALGGKSETKKQDQLKDMADYYASLKRTVKLQQQKDAAEKFERK